MPNRPPADQAGNVELPARHAAQQLDAEFGDTQNGVGVRQKRVPSAFSARTPGSSTISSASEIRRRANGW